MRGSRIHKTDCRALLIKLVFGEENTSVREKKQVQKYIIYACGANSGRVRKAMKFHETCENTLVLRELLVFHLLARWHALPRVLRARAR